MGGSSELHKAARLPVDNHLVLRDRPDLRVHPDRLGLRASQGHQEGSHQAGAEDGNPEREQVPALEVAAAAEEPADSGPVQEEDPVPAVAVDCFRRDSIDLDPENRPD